MAASPLWGSTSSSTLLCFTFLSMLSTACLDQSLAVTLATPRSSLANLTLRSPLAARASSTLTPSGTFSVTSGRSTWAWMTEMLRSLLNSCTGL